MKIKNFERLFVNSDATLRDGISIIENGQLKIALVINDNKELIGILSDGDVRRGLLKNVSLDDSVCHAMNSNFICSRDSSDINEIYSLMERKSILQVPILSKTNNVVELFVHKTLTNKEKILISNPVVLMAGGKGKRLRPLTENCPKPMLKVNGKPILEILIEKLSESGFKNFYLSVNYLKEQIMDFFEDGTSRGVNIKYLIEEKPLGTAGSLTLLPDSVKEPILVMNADVLTKFNPVDLLRFHKKNNAQATLAVHQSEIKIPFGVVKTKGIDLLEFQEKPSQVHTVNAGVYIINPNMIKDLERDKMIDMPNVLQDGLKKNYRVIVCPIHEYWIDIGMPDKLSQVALDMGNNI